MSHKDTLWLRLKFAALLSLPAGAAFAGDPPPLVDPFAATPAGAETVKADPAIAMTKIQEQVSKTPKEGGKMCMPYPELAAAALGGLEPKEVAKVGVCPASLPIVSEIHLSDGAWLVVSVLQPPALPEGSDPSATPPPADAPRDVCCYDISLTQNQPIDVIHPPVMGRPLVGDEGQAQVATVASGAAWSMGGVSASEVEALAQHLSPEARAWLATRWLQDGLAEHASVASFARVSLELMALGAPPELLAAVHGAALDEIDHAQRCFALASAYAQRPLGAGALQSPGPRPMSFESLACETFLEACVGESAATLQAMRQRRNAAHPRVIETLTRIIDDEAKHAAIAWKTVSWAIQMGGASVKSALRQAAQEARAELEDAGRASASDEVLLLSAAQLAAHGRLSPAAERQSLVDAWDDIILPTLSDLLAAV